MNPTHWFHRVVAIAKNAKSVGSGWDELLAYFAAQVDAAALVRLRGIPISDEVSSVREQLGAIFHASPPTVRLEALYFGLFDSLDENEKECIGFYVAGIDKFDAGSGDGLCKPAWCPEECYISSDALDAVKEAELAAAGTQRRFLSYAGQIGVALLLVQFSTVGVLPDARRLVGFDSGDIANLTDGVAV